MGMINGQPVPQMVSLGDGPAMWGTLEGYDRVNELNRQCALERVAATIENGEPMLIVRYWVSNPLLDVRSEQWELVRQRASELLSNDEARYLIRAAEQAGAVIKRMHTNDGLVVDINLAKERWTHHDCQRIMWRKIMGGEWKTVYKPQRDTPHRDTEDAENTARVQGFSTAQASPLARETRRGRKRHLTDEERRLNRRASVKKWKAAHPDKQAEYNRKSLRRCYERLKADPERYAEYRRKERERRQRYKKSKE